MKFNVSFLFFVAFIIEILLVEISKSRVVHIRKFRHKRKQPKRFRLDEKNNLTCSITDKYILTYDKMLIDLVTDNCKYDLVTTDCFGQDLVPFKKVILINLCVLKVNIF